MEPTFVDDDLDQVPTLPSRPTSSLASTPSNSDQSLLSLDIEYVRYRKPNLYARLLARCPWVIALLAFIVGSVCVILSATVIPIPDFDDPTKGFNTHSTIINARCTAFSNLINLMRNNTELSYHPHGLQTPRQRGSGPIEKRSVATSTHSTGEACATQKIDTTALKIVFETKSSDQDLFSLRGFQSICDIETTVIRPSLQAIGNLQRSDCHYMISLPLFTMLLQRRKICSLLTNEDITSMKDLLAYCYPYYKEGHLTRCYKHQCTVPKNCTRYNIIFKTFMYLLDVDYNPTENSSRLRYSMLVYNLQLPDTTKYFRETFAGRDISHGSVKIASVFATMNTEFDLFQEFFLEDMWTYIVGIALSCILIILLLYLSSFVLLIATALTVGFSFAMAYVIYFYVLQIKSFPFLNILAALILIAIGADDVFIFFDAWKQAKKDDSQIPLANRIACAFNHAAMSILVTSLTTAGSFFANYVTRIVSIRCFALFAGLAVLANFFFMITWIPAVIVCQSKCGTYLRKRVRFPNSPHIYRVYLEKRAQFSNYIFGDIIPRIVETCWHVCIVVLLGVGITGICIVFYKPRLKGPETAEFPLFPNSQLFAKWHNGIDKHFDYVCKQVPSNIQVWFVWGLLPEDSGIWYDNHDLGTLKFDDNFDLFSHESQTWFNALCNSTIQSGVFTIPQHLKSKCISLFEDFEEVLNDCDQHRFDEFCCKSRKAPFSRHYLEKCFAILWVRRRKYYQLSTKVIFDKNNQVKVIYVNLNTIQPFSTSYKKMDVVYHNISHFLESQLITAPLGLKEGFWTSIFESRLYDLQPFGFYDLQQTLSSGTHYSIILSLSVAAVLMLLTSLNLLLTIYAMVTITLAISVTIGCLVLMGWHLNVVESITISLAVGMSIDFTIHYGISYRLSKERGSMFRTKESFQRVGSAVLMACITTFVAGSAMMPSHILAYIQLGTFLMLVMTFSWLYATFFFQSLCHIIGPHGNFCQVPLPCIKKSPGSEDQNGFETHRSLQLTDPTLILGEINEDLYDSDDAFLLPT